jgi:AraC-like DNA-binding protein
MEYVLLLGVFEAGFLALLLYTKRNKVLPDKILASLFLLYALTILLSFVEVYNRKNAYPYPFLLNLAPCLIVLHGPAIWFYVRSQITATFKFRFIYLLHFLPFTVFLVDYFYRQLTFSSEELVDIAINEDFKHWFVYKVFVLIIALSSVVYQAWGLWLLKRYNHAMKNFFSSPNQFDMQWLRILLTSTLITYLVINAFFVVDLFVHFLPFSSMQPISFVVATVYILFLGYYGHRQTNVFASNSLPINVEAVPQPHLSPDPIDEKEERFVYALMNYMSVEKPYTDSSLTLTKLADNMLVTPEFLSSILNGRLNRNFFDFVNHYRVEEFKKRCNDASNQNFTLLGIAYDCGFNSKATFNRVFKQYTGLTPSEYKSAHSVKRD